MTSVGSGSIIMMLLLLFYSFPPKVNVGTDIVHAVILTGVTGFMHFRLGNIDSGLVLIAVDRLDSRRFDWVRIWPRAVPMLVASSHPLRLASCHRRPHVVGIIPSKEITQEPMNSS